MLLALLCLMAPATARAQELVDLPPTLECSDSVPVAAPSMELRTLRIAVVLHDVPLDEGRRIAQMAERAYAPLGIDLAPTFMHAYVPQHALADVHAHLKTLLGGRRPAWAHAVMLLSAEDLDGGVLDDSSGSADCVGGVATPETAFAIAEGWGSTKRGAEVFAHELGHLLGGHHQHVDCANGTREQSGDGDLCSVMYPFWDRMSLKFGPTEASVVRGFVERYAKPLAAAPPADGIVLSANPGVEDDVCTTPLYVDPAGDLGANPLLQAAEADVLKGEFFVRDGRPWFRVTVAGIDGDIAPGAGVKWELAFQMALRDYRVAVAWDGSSPPTAELYRFDGTARQTVPGVTVRHGTPGVVELPWPVDPDAVVRFGTLRGNHGPLLDERAVGYNGDSAAPRVTTAQVADCPALRPAPAAPPSRRPAGDARRPAPAAAVSTAGSHASAPRTAAPGARSAPAIPARRSGARVIVLRVKGLRGPVRLLDARGRLVGRGTATRSGAVRIRLVRKARAGRYVLTGGQRRIAVRLAR